MFSPIFINMNKSATLKLDKFIQEVLDEQIVANRSFKAKPVVPLVPKTTILIDKEIAQTIYDGKGTLWDDEASVIKVLGKIKNSKQYENVKAQFKIVSSGKDMVTYIRSFTTIMDRLGMVSVLKGKISVPTLKTIVTYGDYKTAMLKSPSIANKFKIGTATAAASNMLTTMTMNSKEWYGSQKKVDDSSNTIADFWHEFSGEYDPWMETHSTWDTFINGANGKKDGIRSEVYSLKGIVTTTISSALPSTRVLTGIFFGLLAADDIIRIANGKPISEVWMDLLFDLIGVFAGGGATIAKSALKPIVQLLAKFAAGVKGKALIPFIEAVQKIASTFINTKFGQLLKKLGSGIVTTITSIINKFTSSLVSILTSLAKKFPKLTSFCKRIIKLIKSVASTFGQYFASVGKDFWSGLKVLWKIISSPGRRADEIAQYIMQSRGVVVKGAFGAGAKVYVNLRGFQYIIEPGIEKLMNPSVEDAEAKMIVAAEAALSGAILGLPKTGNTIYCYTLDANGNLNYKFPYEMFYVPVDIADSTVGSQPVPIMMHTETKDGVWMEIDITTDINAYNTGALYNATYWVDSRQLIQINKVPVNKYITKNNKK